MHNFSRKIKVCHINTRFLRGGGAKNTLLTIKGLDKNIFDVHLIVGSDVFWQQLNQLKDVQITQVKSLVRNPHLIKDLLALFKLFKIIKRNRYDIVHTHIAKAGFLGRFAAWAAGVPVIIHSIHGITFPETINPVARYFYIFCEKLAASVTTHFIPVGKDLRLSYLEHKIGKADRYTVIRSGMDLAYFRSAINVQKHAIDQLKSEFHILEDDIVVGYVASAS